MVAYENIHYNNPDNPLVGVPNGTMAFQMRRLQPRLPD